MEGPRDVSVVADGSVARLPPLPTLLTVLDCDAAQHTTKQWEQHSKSGI